MAFKWNSYRLARLRSAVASYNAAITREAKRLDSEGMGHMADFLPERITVDSVKSRIHDANDFRRIVGYRNDLKRGRSSELTRILRSYDPHALDVVDDGGVRQSAYAAREQAINRRAEQRRRRKERADLARSLAPGDVAVDLDAMGAVESSAFTADNDLGLADGEHVPNEGIDEATLAKWRMEDSREQRSTSSVSSKVEVWLSVWRNPENLHDVMPLYHEAIEAIEWMMEFVPDYISKIFNMGYDECDPNYIIDSGRNNPYMGIPYEQRHMNAANFMIEKARAAGYVG